MISLRADLFYDDQRRHLSGPLGSVALRQQEHVLLCRLLTNKNRLMDRGALFAACWPNPDDEPEYGEAALHAVVCRLRSKIDAVGGNGKDVVQTVWGVGYLLRI